MRITALVLGLFLLPGCGARAGEAPAPAPRAEDLRQQQQTKDVQKLRTLNQKEYNDAFNKSIVLEPQEAESFLKRSQEQMERVNPDDAGDPAVGRVLFQRGYLAAEAGDCKKAIELYEELVKRFPDHAYADDALYQIGYLYQKKLKDCDQAAAAYQRLARLYADRETAGQAMYQKAQIAVEQQRLGDAQQLFMQSRDAIAKGRFDRGQEAFRNFYETQADNNYKLIVGNLDAGVSPEALALYLKGVNDCDENRPAEAARSFAALLEKHPRSRLADEAAFQLAECLRRQGKLTEAAKAYEAFVGRYPEGELAARARFQLAEFRRLAGDEPAARKLYEAVAGLPEAKDAGEELRRCRALAARRLEELGAGRAAQQQQAAPPPAAR